MAKEKLEKGAGKTRLVHGLARYILTDPWAIKNLNLNDYPSNRFPDGVNEVSTHYMGNERWAVQIAHEDFTILDSQKKGYRGSGKDDFASYNILDLADQEKILRYVNRSDSLSKHIPKSSRNKRK